MSFANGAMTFRRFVLMGTHPTELDEDWRGRVAQYAFGRAGVAAGDGVEAGWIVPTHLFDVDFREAHRLTVGRFGYLAMRMDRTAAPPAVVRSYCMIEEQAASRASGKDHLSRTERQLAREAAQRRAEEEAKQGLFRRITAVPVLMDLAEGMVYLGSTSKGIADRFCRLFADTFDCALTPLTTEELGFRHAQAAGLSRAYEDVAPAFLAELPAKLDDSRGGMHDSGSDRSFLGREFLAWLWYTIETGEGLVERNGVSVTLAIHRSLKLVCPLGRTGEAALNMEAPASSPEAWAALAAGKLPARACLLIGSSRGEWSLVLEGANMNVSSLAVPQSDERDALAILEERFNELRNACSVLDSLYDVFLRLRLTGDWTGCLAAMKRWATAGRTPLVMNMQRATA